MRFSKSFSKSDYFIIFALSVILLFAISFNIAMKFTNKKISKSNENVEVLSSNSESEEKLSENSKVILKLRKNDSEINKFEVSYQELKKLISGEITLNKVKEYYGKNNFQYVEEKNNKIVFVKNTSYIPGKYYIGVTDQEFVAVFKCDNYGNLLIEKPEEDIINRTLETLPEGVQESLKEFKYEYGNKEEALDELMAICS
ncbi:hypothetical protein N3C_0266 [Clostridium sp. N3C]|uniref:hypothetical protein n=1 Tax=Clostridium sp. N3C TaxID=1776758 RepID=UPI00092DFFE3|nr:hypothetical protein [Clostridium sp. N3C]SCN21484.1 hypothetical protein N3C_0266 [Clostridium sp. N3C]